MVIMTAATDTPTLTAPQRARAFVDEILIPREVQAERAGGRLPQEEVELIRREALERGLAGGRHAVEHGGQGWTAVEWFLVEEQLGRSTNGLSWHMPSAYNVLASGSPEQIERYLKPALRGELHDAYAVTEEHAGSDPSGIRTTATRTPSGWRLDGEKWFVTYGDIAAVYIVMALVVPEEPDWSGWPAQNGSWAVPPPTAPSTDPSPQATPTPGAAPLAPPAFVPIAPSRPQSPYSARHHDRTPGAGGLVFGSILVLVGLWLLLVQFFPALNFDLVWPLFIVGAGVVLLVAAVGRGSAGSGTHP